MPAKKTTHKPTAIDLFSGCGGLTQGLKAAGFNVVAAVEMNPKARATYTLNHPEIWLAGEDIRKTKPTQLLEKLGLQRGQLDLLAGCPPCQGFSRIRKRNKVRAARDDRNALISDFARFVRVLRPRRVMMENVPGLKDHFRFDNLRKSLESMGYQTRFEVLNVSAYGVAQRRKRLIFVASIDGEPALAKASKKIKSVRNAIGHLPHPSKSTDVLHRVPENRSKKVQELIRLIPKNGGSRKDLPPDQQLGCHQRTDGFSDVYGRMRWDAVAPTITGGCHNPSKGRFLHPSQNRTITLREAALLQGFPAGYRFDTSHGKEEIALMIGNALPPPFISAHARSLVFPSAK